MNKLRGQRSSYSNWNKVSTFRLHMSFVVELWVAHDIMSPIHSIAPKNDTLINPGNPSFCGTIFPYFPIGGPLPKETMTNRWGGMSVGENMKYPSQCIDGLVHQLGGKTLKEKLREARRNFVRRDHGSEENFDFSGLSLLTTATEKLRSICQLDYVIHTAVPLCRSHYSQPGEELLSACYQSSVGVALGQCDIHYIICPLLGSGTSGFSHKQSTDAFAGALSRILSPALQFNCIGNKTLRLVAQNESSFDHLPTTLLARVGS